MALEEEFDTEIPDEAEKITTVQAAIDYINGHRVVNISAVVRPPEFYLCPTRIIFPSRRTNVSKRRVVVTGLGMLSPVGNTVESTGKPACRSSGISLIDHFDTSAYATKFAGLVRILTVRTLSRAKNSARWMPSFNMELSLAFRPCRILALK